MSPKLVGRFFITSASWKPPLIYISITKTYEFQGLPQWLSGKESARDAEDARDAGLIPGLGRSSGGGHGNPFQYSCLENPMHRGAWWATQSSVSQRVRYD